MKIPPRLLVIGVAWPPETFIQRLLLGLLDAGMEITVAWSRKPGEEWLSKPNFRWLYTPSWNINNLYRLFATFYLLKQVIFKSLLKNSKFRYQLPKINFRETFYYFYNYLPFINQTWDVVYFPWIFTAVKFLPLFENLCPMVVSCRGSQVNIAPYDPDRAEIIAGLRQTIGKAAAVHCVSEAIKKEAMQYGLNPAKAWVIRPAVDPDFFCPAADKKSGNTLRIITTGSMIWRKGYEHALSAVRLLRDQGIAAAFQIIGDGWERARVLYTIDDLGLHQQVHWHGKQPPSEVRRLLQEADVFLLASLSEGISNAALEAMACGLPVVTTDCGGMREALTDGVEGFVVPVRDPEAMAAALARLAKDPDLRARMGQAGRQRVLRDFTLQEQIQAFAALLAAAQAAGRSG